MGPSSLPFLNNFVKVHFWIHMLELHPLPCKSNNGELSFAQGVNLLDLLAPKSTIFTLLLETYSTFIEFLVLNTSENTVFQLDHIIQKLVLWHFQKYISRIEQTFQKLRLLRRFLALNVGIFFISPPPMAHFKEFSPPYA